MWCKQCQLDVPGIATVDEAETAEVCCARCGEMLVAKPLPEADSRGSAAIRSVVGDSVSDDGIELSAINQTPSADKAPSRPSPPNPLRIDPSPLGDDWQLDDELQQAAQIAGTTARSRQKQKAAYGRELYRIDPAHRFLGGWQPHVQQPRGTRSPLPPKQSSPQTRTSPLAMLALSLGMAALVCGGVLLGWSFVPGYERLWSLGTPIALGGQLVLLVGLVLQLERLWQENRQASDKLSQVDEQLSELKDSTRLLSRTHGTASQSFYAHMAEGASPQMLLTDLKGQLDLLANRLNQER